MAILGINPVSPRREPVKPREPTWYEKLESALGIAGSAFNIATDIQSLRRSQSAIDQAESQSKLADLELKRQESEAAGLTTPRQLQARGESVIPSDLQGPIGPGQRQLGREVQLAKIVDGERLQEMARVAPTELINQLAVASEAEREGIVDFFRKAKNAANLKKVVDAEEAFDKHKITMKQHPFVRRLSGEIRNRIGKATNAYVALQDLENEALRGLPLDRKIGDSVASLAATRFAEYLGRLQSGAVISEAGGVGGFLGYEKKEMERFRDLLPRPGDTVRAARSKIDILKKDLEGSAVSLGNGDRKEFLDFVGTIQRETVPLARAPRFEQTESEAEAIQKKAERVGEFIGAGVKGLFKAGEEAIFRGGAAAKEQATEFVGDKFKAIKNFFLEGIFGPSETQQGAPQPAAPPSPTPPPVEDRAIPPQGAAPSPFQGGGLDARRQGGLGALTGAKRVITKQGGLGALTNPEKKKRVGG